MAKRRGGQTRESKYAITAFEGDVSDDEGNMEAAGLADPDSGQVQDAPSEGSSLGDETPHKIVMGGDDDSSSAPADDYDPEEFRGAFTNSFVLPQLTEGANQVQADGSYSAAGVIGSEDRRRINNTRKYPFRAICALLMTGTNGRQSIGTGWFAGPNLIVTAGHNLFDNGAIGRNSGWIQSVQVWPGRNGNTKFETEIAGQSQLGVSESWRNRTADRALLDYGVIRLKNGLGKKVGWFGLKYWPSDQLQGKDFNVVGYPQGTRSIPSWTMWYDIGSITAARMKTIEYTMDTTPGESGSPVVAWVDDRTEKGSMVVVGIHNYGMGNFNQATRITPAVLDTISQLAK